MKWVTREKEKVDRIACPWLIKNFIDKDAEFLFVPENQVLAVAEKEHGTSFDASNAQFMHTEDGKCTFEALVEHYKITDLAIQKLARVVHGAYVARDSTITPQSASRIADYR